MKPKLEIFQLIAGLLCGTGPALSASDFRVSDYGAVAGDGRDDTGAIQTAIKAAIKIPGSAVLFEPGIYDLVAPKGTNGALAITAASNLTLRGAGAELRIQSASNGMIIQDSTNVRLENLSLDWGSLPFAEAKVISFEGNDPIVSIVGGTAPSLAGTPVTSLFLYDEVQRRPAGGDNDWYSPGTLTALTDGTARLAGFPINVKRVGTGASLLIRYQTYGANAIVCINNRQLTFANVSVHSAPGMAISLSGCENVLLSEFLVSPKTNSTDWISTNADGIHAVFCRGDFTISNSIFEAMGDDALNICGLILVSQAGATNSQVILRHGKPQGSGFSPPRVGDILKFSSLNDPYNILFSASVLAAPSYGQPVSVTVTLDQDVPVSLRSGAVVINTSAQPVIHLDRISIKNNRARGMWLQGLSGDVKSCIISGSSGPAVECRADVNKWWEGPAPSVVSFTNCHFEDCNYGPGKSTALISSYAEESTGAITAVRALGTLTFSQCDFISKGPLLSFNSTRSITVTDSRYSGNFATPLTADALTSVTESGNNLTGSGASPIFPRVSIKVSPLP